MGEDEEDEGSTNATVREGGGAPARSRKDDYLADGATVGRYIVKERLGEGGMGVVYAATDPELDRTVALKLLQTRRGDEREPAWLLREAQALARLSHPNVVAIYDVGTLPGDRVFIAMEHVEGETLRVWARRGQPWRRVIEAMRGAGAGLAAAHAVGLVHRDFKPDNVIVGRDGRVRVMDFGLARLRVEGETPTTPSEPPLRNSDLSIESRSPLSASLTIAGEVFGTPAYMAPELYQGMPADARTDQFSFGVALYEALFRKRPYKREQLAAPTAPLVPAPPPPSDVPVRLQRVVMRALAPRPEDRFESMAALLDVLVVESVRARRLAWLGAGALVLAGGIGATALALRGHAEPPPCQGLEQRLAGVWDPAAKQTLAASFVASKLPYAERVAAGIERTLDGYTAEWVAAAAQSCRATRVERTQPEDVLALRQACLDQRLDEAHALIELFAKADAPLVDKADKAVAQLPPIARCANVAALLAPDRPPPELVAQLAQIRRQVVTAKAAVYAGRAAPALAVIDPAIETAKQLGFEPLTADALYVRGSALGLTAKWEPAAGAFAEAAWAAIRGRRDDIAGEAALTAAQIAADGLGKPAEAKIWLGLARAALARLHDRNLDLELLEVEGIVDVASGDTAGGIAAHREALRAAEAFHGPNDSDLWRPLFTLASTLSRGHAFADATPYYERALALHTASVGDLHPDIALILTNLGAAYDHGNAPDKARTSLERALAIRETTFGADSPRLIATLNNMADLLKKQRDYAAALVAIARAEAIAAKVPGTAHPLYHTVLTTLGEIRQAAGDRAGARTALDEALALETKTTSPMLPTTLASRADLAIADKAYADAAALAGRAVAALEAAGGAMNPELWRPLASLATAHRELKHLPLARASADRALAIAAASKLADPDLAELQALRATIP